MCSVLVAIFQPHPLSASASLSHFVILLVIDFYFHLLIKPLVRLKLWDGYLKPSRSLISLNELNEKELLAKCIDLRIDICSFTPAWLM